MKTPFYIITASVPPGNRVLRFHGTGDDSASHLLANVPRFRYAGFDVAIPDWPQPGPDNSLELRWDDRKILRLYQDGTLIFRARADYNFLGWGVEPHEFEEFPKLNPVPVVEVNTSFVHLYRSVLGYLKNVADTIYFQLSLHDGTWPNGRLFMTEYSPNPTIIGWDPVNRWEIQMDPAEEEVEVSSADLVHAPNRVAYLIVWTFTSMFDLPGDKIPFVRRVGEELEIDLDAIRGLR